MRLSELYTSIQCEGPNTGQPTQFVRFAGCNYRCPGWPCDTEHAINPAIWKHEADVLLPEQLFERLAEYPHRLCLTGGEPFMQRHGEMQEFVEMCLAAGYSVECFTNGSFRFPDWAMRSMSFMMDWKLQGSGETNIDYIPRVQNAQRLRRSDGIKFVCVDLEDLEEARVATNDLRNLNVMAQLWVAPAWNRIDVQSIIDYTMDHQLPWRLNLQVHKMIWNPEARGV